MTIYMHMKKNNEVKQEFSRMEQKMDIKWIFIDIDGTLIDSRYQISERNKKAVRAAVDKGINVSIASGRMYRSVAILDKELGLFEKDFPLITYQGAYVKTSRSGKVLCQYSLDVEIARELVALAKEHDLTPHAYLDDTLCVEFINRSVANYCRLSMVPAKSVGDLSAYIDRPPHKILFAGEPEVLDRLWQEQNQKYGDSVYITKSKPFYLEFMNPLANKGEAVRFLSRDFNLRKEEIMAIGDSFNDLMFFEGAGLKVAMGNGVQELKEAADYVTADCDHDGVAEAIEKFIL